MLFVTLCAIISPGLAVVTKSDWDEFYEVVSHDALLSDKFNFIMENMPETYLEEIVGLGAVLGYQFTAKDVKKSISEQGNYVCLPLGCWSTFTLEKENY